MMFFGHRKTWLLALIACAFSLTLLPAKALTLQVIEGTTFDPLGRPLQGVRVDDGQGGHVTYSNSLGEYRIEESSIAPYTVCASRSGLVGYCQKADPLSREPLNFVLSYALGFAGIPTLGASANRSQTIKVSSAAPAEGQCVTFDDVSTATKIPLVYDAGLWTGSVDFSGRPDGAYPYSITATDCVSVSLAHEIDAVVRIDTVPPVLSDGQPHISASSTRINLSATDSLSGIIPSSMHLEVDGAAAPQVTLNGTRMYASMSGLTGGAHTVTVSASDYGQNVSTYSFTFQTDVDAPILSDESPVGQISNRSPRIQIRAVDVLAGIDDHSVTMTLNYGVLSSALPASYDSQTGIVSYQVPDFPIGVMPGQGPLLDGAYTATASVADTVGNVSTETWAFEVKTLT